MRNSERCSAPPVNGDGLLWRKSVHSNPNGACVEVAPLPGGGVAMRHSRHPGGDVLMHDKAAFRAFLTGAKNGEFDDLADPDR